MRAAARVTFLATLAGVGFIVSPAQAQLWDWGYGFGQPRPPIVDRPARYYLERPIPSGEVIEILRDEGYRALTRPVLSGDAYIADVENRRGQRLQVVVHAYDGDILERRLLTGRPSPERPNVRRPAQPDEAALPPRTGAPVESVPLSPVMPPPAQSAPVSPRPADERAAAPPVAPLPAPPHPRDSQTVTPPKAPAPPAAARPREPARAAVPPVNQAPPKIEQNAAPTLETTEPPKEQQARSPRVVLPNPADSSQNSMPPPTTLETQPSNPAPPTPPVAPAPLN